MHRKCLRRAVLLFTGRWQGFCMECLGSVVIFFAALFAVLQRDTIGSAVAGLSVSYSLQVRVLSLQRDVLATAS